MTTSLPSTKVSNPAIAGPNGEQVTMIDVLEISEGDEISIVFESVSPPWRQGVWLATTGQLETNGAVSSQFTLWMERESGASSRRQRYVRAFLTRPYNRLGA